MWRPRLSILIYHRVLPEADPRWAGNPIRATFDWQMRCLKRLFRVVSLEEGIDRLYDGTLQANAACVTFDDGYADNYTVAAPILEKYGIPATFFIATGYLNGGIMWNDLLAHCWHASHGQIAFREYAPDLASADGPADVINSFKYLPPKHRGALIERIADEHGIDRPVDLMMSDDQVIDLAARGHTIGAHTHSHPILCNLSDEEARREVITSRDLLGGMTGKAMRLFAFPNGKPDTDYSRRDVEIVRSAGFDAAVSTTYAAATDHHPRFELPRCTPWDRTPLKFSIRLAANHMLTRTPVSAS